MPDRSLFGGLFSRLFHASPAPPPAPERESAHEQLDDLLRSVQEQAREEVPGAAATRKAAQGPSAEEIALAERESARARLEADIVAFHARLGTGLEGRLGALADWLRAHAPRPAGPDEGTERRIDARVLKLLFERAGLLAWERLEELMELAGEPWPVPQSLVIGRPSEDAPRVLAQHRRELQEDFVAADADRVADLVHGEIRAWSHYYPDSSTTLWQEVALRGVASAVRIQLFEAMIDEWGRRPEELEARIGDVLDGELQDARKLLAQGVQSLEGARRIAAEVDRVCGLVIPDMVWDFLGPRLRQQPNYPGAPRLGAATRRLT